MKFRDLKIGDTFDFISTNQSLNSFLSRCKKISPRKYRANKTNHQVGSVHVEVYHVNVNEEKEDE